MCNFGKNSKEPPLTATRWKTQQNTPDSTHVQPSFLTKVSELPFQSTLSMKRRTGGTVLRLYSREAVRFIPAERLRVAVRGFAWVHLVQCTDWH